MNIQDADLTLTAPLALKYDEKQWAVIVALAAGLKASIGLVDVAGIYYRIDSLSEEMLDMVSEDLGVHGYQSSYSIDIKRERVKNAIIASRQAGTVAGFLASLESITGTETEISEWFEDGYNGDPYHFSLKNCSANVVYSNQTTSSEVRSNIDSVKRLSTVLDGIQCVDHSYIDIDSVYLLDEDEYVLTDEYGVRLVC